MKRILLPTDFSKISVNAIEYILSLYAEKECEYYLLNVYNVPYMTNEELMEHDAQQLSILESELYKASQENLKKLLETLPVRENHQFHMISDYNYFIGAVKSCLEEKELDLVVMGTKGATGAKEIFLGTNTGDVLMKTDCNALAVPENSQIQAPKEIVFPTDFKIRYQRESMNPLIELAKMHKAKIRILHLSESTVLEIDQVNNKKILETFLEGIEFSYHTLSNTDFEEALNCFTQSRGDIDMIAMLAGHYNFFQRLFFRPKVMELSFHTNIPMLVLHQIE